MSIDKRFLDPDYWSMIAEFAQNGFQMCEEYLVSQDVLDAYSRQHGGLVSFHVSDAGEVPIKVVVNKTNFFALKTEKYVIYPKKLE